METACREIRHSLGDLRRLSAAVAFLSAGERRQIRELYDATYKEDLIERLHREHSANPENELLLTALCLWMMDPFERDAVVARKAMNGEDAQFRALVEIYTSRKPSHLFYINRAYQARFRRSLDQDILSQPPQPYQKILVALAASHRSHRAEPSQEIARSDAKRLFEAGKGGAEPVDEALLLELLSKRSVPQLRLTFSVYERIYGIGYTQSLKKIPPGEFQESLRTVLKCLCDPHRYFAKVLYACMKGTIPDRSALPRVMASRAEVDMAAIEGAFEGKYGLKLPAAIRVNVRHEGLRSFLLALTTATTTTTTSSSR